MARLHKRCRGRSELPCLTGRTNANYSMHLTPEKGARSTERGSGTTAVLLSLYLYLYYTGDNFVINWSHICPICHKFI